MSYVKQNWSNGDLITAEKLNHMEDGIEASLPEACQFNADHTVKFGQQYVLAPAMLHWLETHWGGENIEATDRYFTALWDNETQSPKYPRGTTVVSDFLEIEDENSQLRHVPFTAVVEPEDFSSIEITFNIYGYMLITYCGINTDAETTSKTFWVGEVVGVPDYNVITQIIDNDDEEIPEEDEDVQGEI